MPLQGKTFVQPFGSFRARLSQESSRGEKGLRRGEPAAPKCKRDARERTIDRVLSDVRARGSCLCWVSRDRPSSRLLASCPHHRVVHVLALKDSSTKREEILQTKNLWLHFQQRQA